MTLPSPLSRAAVFVVGVCMCVVVVPLAVLAALAFCVVVVAFAAVFVVCAVVGAAYQLGGTILRDLHRALSPVPPAPPGVGLDGRTCETCGEEATHFVRDGIVRLDAEGGWITRGEGPSTTGPLRAFCRDHARPPRAVFDPPTASGGDPADRRPDLPD